MDNRYLITVTPETIGEKKGTYYGRVLKSDNRLHEFEHVNNTYYISDGTCVTAPGFARAFYGIPCRKSRSGNTVYEKSPDGSTITCSLDYHDSMYYGVAYVVRGDGRALRIHVQTVEQARHYAALSMRAEAKAEVEAAIAGATRFTANA